MFAKKMLFLSLLFAVLLAAAGILIIARPAQAGIETFTSGGTSSCLTCHENRYYLYDTGKHYCLTEAASRCVYCHDGNPDAADEETAHAGLVAHPIVNGDISRCVTCHPQDAQAHVDKFAALAGCSPVVHVASQVQPAVPVQTAEGPQQAAFDAKTVTGVSIVLAVVLVLLVLCFLTNRSCH